MNDLKRNLCNYLIKNNIVKENDVIQHNYTVSKFGEKCIKNNNISPTVTAKSNTSMNSSMLLLKDEYKGMFQYSKSDQFMKGKDRFQNDKEVSDCLTTDVKEGVVLIKNATKQGYLEAKDGDGIDISSRMEYHRGTVQKESTQTITTKGGENIGVIVQEQYDFSDLD